MVGILVSFWDGLSSGAMLVFGSVFALFDPPQMGNLMIPGQSVCFFLFFCGCQNKNSSVIPRERTLSAARTFLGNMMERCSESLVLVGISEKQQICVKYFRFNLDACIGHLQYC